MPCLFWGPLARTKGFEGYHIEEKTLPSEMHPLLVLSGRMKRAWGGFQAGNGHLLQQGFRLGVQKPRMLHWHSSWFSAAVFGAI